MGNTKADQAGLSRRNFISESAAVGAGLLTVEIDSKGAEAATSNTEKAIASLPRVKQELVAPPFFPEHDPIA